MRRRKRRCGKGNEVERKIGKISKDKPEIKEEMKRKKKEEQKYRKMADFKKYVQEKQKEKVRKVGEDKQKMED